MKFRQIVVILVLMINLTGCSVQNKLVRDFKGKTQAELVLAKGKPSKIEPGENGGAVYVYLKSKLLKAAPINTGQFQYDRFESPKAVKTETSRFYLNSTGVIVDVTFEVSYSR